MHVSVPIDRLPDEFCEPEDLFFAQEGDLAVPRMGSLASVPVPREGAAHQRAQAGASPGRGDPKVYPDTGSIKIRRDNADWVPEVQRDFPHLLVGTGRIKGPFCGTFHAEPGRVVGACATQPGKHKPVLIPNSCKRRECPECWPTWANMGKKRVAGVLNSYLNAKLKSQRQIDPTAQPDYYPVHVSFHPPRELVVRLVKETKKELAGPECITSDQFHNRFIEKFRRECDLIRKEAGVSGCVEIYHSIRLRSDRDNYEADAMRDLDRYRDILNFTGWEGHVKFSPHSHCLLFGYLENSESLCERTGWTYRRHRVVSNAEGIVYYLLSHAPVFEGKHNIRYCGCLNKHRLMVEGEITVPVFPDCPECLEDGGEHGKSGYVVAKLGDVSYNRDERGKKSLESWSFEHISHKPYRQTRHIKVYRILKPGEKPDRKGLSKLDRVMPFEHWETLTDKGKLRFQWRKYYTLAQWIDLPLEQKPFDWV